MENNKGSYKMLILDRVLKLVSNQYDTILNQYFAPFGLTTGQGEVLAYLCRESDRTVEPDELSAVMRISPAALTKILNNLSEKWFVQYSDERTGKKQVLLTVHAANIAEQLAEVMHCLDERLLRRISYSEYREVLSILQKSSQNSPDITKC